MRFAITFDYLCPFAAIANETVVTALEAGAPHEVEFRAFSLSQVHLDDDTDPVWKSSEPASGVLALYWGLAVRDTYPDRFPTFHRALFQARHLHAADINDPAVLRKVAGENGLTGAELDEVERLIDEGSPAKALEEDHTWGVERYRVFGVPTWIAGDQAVFTRLMERQPTPDAAVATVDRVLDLVTGWVQLNEFKHTSIPR
jgi:hypothetical protein